MGGFRQPELHPGPDIGWQFLSVARNHNDIGAGGILGRHFSKLGNSQHLELPHLINKSAIMSEILYQEIVRFFRVLAGLKILVHDHDAKSRIDLQVGRFEGFYGKSACHGSMRLDESSSVANGVIAPTFRPARVAQPLSCGTSTPPPTNQGCIKQTWQ